MNSSTAAWVARPLHRTGLDNLGTQQPCVFIYSHMLPGITNVTDRAIYYGFYPWFMRTFALRAPDANGDTFRNELRKADCLLTLIAHRHAASAEDTDSSRHAGACPGSLKLGPAIHSLEINEALPLVRYADLAHTNEDRYFKNPLGGLGQYYLGALRDELGVLTGDARIGLQFIHEVADPIAADFADIAEEELFFQALARGTVTVNDLDGLAAFCPCAIADGLRPNAQRRLSKLIFGDECLGDLKARRRRGTLTLLLDFLDQRGGMEADDPVQAFLCGCYSGSLDGATTWELPEGLVSSRKTWALYARNEMLSLAWLALFKSALDSLDGLPKPIFGIVQTADWLLSQPKFAYRPEFDFDLLIANERQELPLLGAINDERHETQLWIALAQQPDEPVQLAATLLQKLVARSGSCAVTYGDIGISIEDLSGYPLNLAALEAQARQWSGLAPDAWVRALLVEVLSTHQRVAIRKLGQSGEDTLMFRTGEQGLFVDRTLERIPQTQPRLRQALQIIRDLALCEPFEPGYVPRLTNLGVERLAACRV